jgi:hypothetical protein
MKRDGLRHVVDVNRRPQGQAIWPLEISISEKSSVVVTKVNPSPKKAVNNEKTRNRGERERKTMSRMSRSTPSGERERVYPNLLTDGDDGSSLREGSPSRVKLDVEGSIIEGSMIITPSHASLSASHKSPTSRTLESMSVS